jgi:hypothetical protein
MNPEATPVVLVIDDNSADIELLEAAWSEAGLDQSISISSFTHYDRAMAWLHDGMPADSPLAGVLVDLLLFDASGKMIIENICDMPSLQGIPIISWSGIDAGKMQTDRIRKSSARIWGKPADWSAYTGFIRRFYDVISGGPSSASPRLPLAKNG